MLCWIEIWGVKENLSLINYFIACSIILLTVGFLILDDPQSLSDASDVGDNLLLDQVETHGQKGDAEE